MKSQILALALLVTVIGSVANAGEMKRACIDSQGGTYTASDDGSMKCENRSCILDGSEKLSSLMKVGPMSTLDETDSEAATALAQSLQSMVSGPMIEGDGNEPFFYLGLKMSVLCSSFMPEDIYNDANISNRLSEQY